MKKLKKISGRKPEVKKNPREYATSMATDAELLEIQGRELTIALSKLGTLKNENKKLKSEISDLKRNLEFAQKLLRRNGIYDNLN